MFSLVNYRLCSTLVGVLKLGAHELAKPDTTIHISIFFTFHKLVSFSLDANCFILTPATFFDGFII